VDAGDQQKLQIERPVLDIHNKFQIINRHWHHGIH
jgi:hypothetical protein